MSRPRQPKPERADTWEPTVALAHGAGHLPRGVEVVAGEVDVERDQWRTRTDDHPARAIVEPPRPEIRGELANVDPPLQLLRASTPEEGRPATGREVGVEEDRQRELIPHAPGELERRGPRALCIDLLNRHQRNDVGRTHAGMRTFVATQVDPLPGARNAGEERCDKLLFAADECVHRAVVILVRVDVEQARVTCEGVADRGDRRAVAPLREVGDGFEREHRR
jgi:hypothetical protein